MSLATWVVLGLLLGFQSADPRATASEILADPAYQSELPATETPLAARGRSSERASGPASGLTLPPALITVATWGVLAVGALLLGLLIAQTLRGLRPTARERTGGRVATARIRGHAAAQALPDAEALASQERFTEAIHALLLHALRALAGSGTHFAPGTTSREIVARVALETGRRQALTRLVRAVEGSLFGGRVADRTDYESCLRLSRQLQTAGDER